MTPIVRLEIRINELRAIAPFASVDETRYVLNGILIELSADKRALMIGTDGRRLGVLRCENTPVFHPTPDGDPSPINFILPSSLIDLVISATKVADNDNKFPIWLELAPGTAPIKPRDAIIKFGDFSVSSKEIEGTYPNWRSTLPTRSPASKTNKREFLVLNAKYFESFCKASSQLCIEPRFALCGDNLDPISIRIGKDFFGLLMPMRVNDLKEESLSDLPVWL